MIEIEELLDGDEEDEHEYEEMNEEVVDPEGEAAWDTEIRRRIAEIDNGKVDLLDGEEVMTRIRAELGL